MVKSELFSRFLITDFCQPLQTSELDAVLFLKQELNNGFFFNLYIFHFKSVTFILEYFGNKIFKCTIKISQHSEVIPIILLCTFSVCCMFLYKRILYIFFWWIWDEMNIVKENTHYQINGEEGENLPGTIFTEEFDKIV